MEERDVALFALLNPFSILYEFDEWFERQLLIVEYYALMNHFAIAPYYRDVGNDVFR